VHATAATTSSNIGLAMLGAQQKAPLTCRPDDEPRFKSMAYMSCPSLITGHVALYAVAERSAGTGRGTRDTLNFQNDHKQRFSTGPVQEIAPFVSMVHMHVMPTAPHVFPHRPQF
jgi:hypothetical protein